MPRQVGPEQSRRIAAVGDAMYCQLLERAAKGLDETVAVPSETAIEIGVSGSIATKKPSLKPPPLAKDLKAIRGKGKRL